MTAQPRRKDVENIYPLSPMQQAMLFFIQLEPDSGAGFQQFCYTLEGRVDASALRRAWETLLERHEPLRAEFRWGKVEQPLQIIRTRVELPWHEEDWRGLTKDEQERRLRAYADEDRKRGLDLRRAPLTRIALFRSGDSEWRLVWTCSHLLLDGWSASHLTRELFLYYDAYARGTTLRLPAPKPFADFIGWLQQRPMAEAEEYFRRALDGVEPTTFGLARRRADIAGAPGVESVSISVSSEASGQIAAFARRRGLTVAVVVQAAWALLLSRYSGREDVVFGIAVAGRPTDLPGADSMVGSFLNTLPLRLAVPADQSVGEWLDDVRRRQVQLRQYEYVPLTQIHRWSGLRGGVALFESAVAFENYPKPESLAQSNAQVRPVDIRPLFDGLLDPITLLLDAGEQLGGVLQYQRSLFDREAMDRLADRFVRVLAELPASADRPVREVSFLSDEERNRLLGEWNATAAPIEPQPMHALVEERAARTPDRIAVSSDGVHLSYGALEQIADELAARLGELGVRRGHFVGLCAEPSVEVIVGLLGILKAGGGYLPMDPSYPPDRLAFMGEDAGIGVLLADATGAARVPDLSATVVRLEDLPVGARGGSPGGAQERIDLSAECPVYAVYTSGSTGKPKGVCIPHRALFNHMAWMTREFGFAEADTLLFTSSLSFDASAWQIFGPLMTGGRLVMVPPDVVRDPGRLLDWIRDEQTTLMLAVPSLLEMLVQHSIDGYEGLRFLFTGGEASSAELARATRERFPATFVNLYGPTESTIDATSYQVRGPVETSTVPIGLPIQNVTAHVLDDRLAPVPPGVAAELYLGGLGLAWGYHRRPGLTAGRFIPDPFSQVGGSRLYRTGDLVRRLPDGNIEFLGRRDHQVKIRGYRIELGEVEAVLRRHPEVRQALAVVREDRPEDRRLVAYVVGIDGPSAVKELQEACRAALPDYMVPSAIVALPELPLTPAGKIDRRALPAPDGQEADSSYVPPGSPIERQMATLWEELLGVRRVGALDDFFALGGHSQLAVKLVAMVEQAFGARLPLVALLDDATVRGLVQKLEGVHAVDEDAPLIQLRDGAADQTLFLLHASSGTVTPYVHLVRQLGRPFRVYGVQLPGVEHEARRYADLREQLADYAKTLRTVQPKGPYRLVGWSVGGLLAYELAQLLVEEGDEVRCVVMLDASVPPREAKDLVSEVTFVASVWFYEVAAMTGAPVPVHPQEFEALGPERCVDHAIARLREIGAIPPEAPAEAWHARFDSYLGNVRRAAEATLRPYAGRLVLLRAEERLLGRPYGWNELSQNLEIIPVPGNHFSILLPPHVEAVAAKLREVLER